MAMLAERRQKQKWTLNPRGKWWTEDSNKFGQRMLEKMGWTKGKGLGINEQGITEFSSVSYKSDTTGMGYDKSFEAWTEQQEKFGDFLQQLNQNQDQDTVKKSVNKDANLSGQSIELKSKQSHARVHYKKFTRGKDINKYKSKDLANIFGQKELADITQTKIEKDDNIRETEASGFRENWYGVATINGGNMADYFKLKLDCNNMTDYLKCNVKSSNNTSLSNSMTDNRTTDSESENDQSVGFGFTPKTEDTSVTNHGALKDSDKNNYAFDNPCLGMNSPTKTVCSTNGSSTKSIKKKEFENDNLHIIEMDKHNAKKKLKTETIDSNCKNGFINPALNLDTKPDEDCNGKEFEVFRAQLGLENCSTNDSSTKSIKKRKKEFENDSLHIIEMDKHNAKKKLKTETIDSNCKNGFINPALNLDTKPDEDCNGKEFEVFRAQLGLENCSTNDSSTKSIKKRKKEFENDSLHIIEMDKHNAKKKLKTETIDSNCKNGFINPALNLDTKPDEDCNGKEFEVFRAQLGLENCSTNDSSTKFIKKRNKGFENDSLHIIEMDKHNVPKKLKTETIDSNCKNGFINPALNLDTKPEEDCNGKAFEVFRAQLGLENCGLDLTDERNDKKRVTFNDHVMLYKYDINSTKKKKGEATLDKFEVKNKKNKKKRKHENITTPMTDGIVNEALDVQISYEEINDNELNEHKNKIKKRKISKTSNLETIQESPEKEIIEINIESENILDSSVIENGEINTVDQKSKKKKKKKEEKKTEVEDITIFHVTNEKPDIEIEEIITSKKIKKYKENKVKEETAISKKCKKEKKKNKKNDKSEEHTIQTEINKDQQDIRILNKPNSKQQQNDCLIENENKDAAVTETFSVTTAKEEGSEEKGPLEKIIRKKKKRKSIEEDCPNKINVCSVEREISDKENTDKEQDPNTKKLAKKDKKSKKSKDVSDIGDSSDLNKEVLDVNVTKEDKIENAESTDTPSKKGKVIDAIDNIINSPWSVKARMSKKMLVTLFHNNAILEFPGSNIHNIKGYGADVECEL